jgi:hypothetical protein
MLPELAERGRVERKAVNGVRNEAGDSAHVQMIDPNGRIFLPGQTGDFEATGKNAHDPTNEKEEEGALGILSEAKLIPRGRNQCRDHTKDDNFQQMLLMNRPEEFVGRLFNKVF